MAKRDKDSIRKKIIREATKLFAEQGYHKTTISDIAKNVGIVESALYDHFQGKEDLLFSIPYNWANDAIEELEEQLYGLEGSFTKLRKFLWWYLRMVERDPNTAKIIFLFLQTNPDFLKAEIYQKVRDFFSSLLEIFEQGVKTGEMKKNMDVYEARTIFWGTINSKITRWLIKGMSYPLSTNLDKTFNLLQDAFREHDGGGK